MKTMSVVLFILFFVSYAPAQQRWAKTYPKSDVEPLG
jgi:hypothetical protein